MKSVTIILAILTTLSSNLLAQWTQVGSGLSYVHAIASLDTCIFASDGSTSGTGIHNVYRCSVNSNNWVQTALDGIDITSMCTKDSFLFVGGCNGGSISKTTDNGASWTFSNNGLPTTGNTCVLSLCSNSTSIFAGTYQGIYRSDNNGINWTVVNTDVTNGYSVCANNIYIYAGTWSSGIYVSTDNGNNWSNTSTGLNAMNICSIISNNNSLFAASYNGVFRSTDNGTNWNNVDTDTTWTLISYNGNVFTGTNHGIKASANNGTLWNDISLGLPVNTKVYSLCINDNYLYAGTKTGVYKRTLSEIVGIENYNNDICFNLFPNPAYDKIYLNSNNQSIANLTLNIYSLTGKLVKSEILKQNQQQINVGDLNNGVYMIEIKNIEWTGKQKLIIQR